MKKAKERKQNNTHILINQNGISFNVSLTIKNNKLIVIWEGETCIIDLNKVEIIIRDK